MTETTSAVKSPLEARPLNVTEVMALCVMTLVLAAPTLNAAPQATSETDSTESPTTLQIDGEAPSPQPSDVELAEALAQLKSGDVAAQKTALFLLGRAAARAALPDIEAALSSDREEVRIWALRTLRLIQGAEARARLLEVLAHDRSPHMRRAAASELEVLRDPATLEPLLAAVQDRDRGVRVAALEAVGALKDPSAVPLVIRMTRIANPVVRRAAVETLGDISDPAGRAAVVNRLRDRDANVRRTAVAALRALGDASVIELLIARLDDRFPSVREEAFRTLRAIVRDTDIPTLERRVWRGPGHVRAYGIELLVHLASAEARAALERHLPREYRRDLKERIERVLQHDERPTG